MLGTTSQLPDLSSTDATRSPEPLGEVIGVRESPPLPPVNETPLTASGRPARESRLPARYRVEEIVLPDAPITLESEDDAMMNDGVNPLPIVENPTDFRSYPPSRQFRTKPNAFGVFRQYTEYPLSIPDTMFGLGYAPDCSAAEPLGNGVRPSQVLPQDDLSDPDCHRHIFHPLPNGAAFHYLQYWYSGDTKSNADQKRFFSLWRLPKYRWQSSDWSEIVNKGGTSYLEALLDRYDPESDLDSPPWKTSDISINIPIPRRRGVPANPSNFSRFYTIPGLQHRSIVSVVKSVLTQQHSQHAELHYQPYFELHNCPTPSNPNHIERMHSEMYSSDVWLREHEAIRCRVERKDSGGEVCDLPKAIAGLMFASDGTQLANFGTQKLWPLYMFFGNQSLWYRGQPTSRCCHHIAYFKSVRI